MIYNVTFNLDDEQLYACMGEDDLAELVNDLKYDCGMFVKGKCINGDEFILLTDLIRWIKCESNEGGLYDPKND